MYRPYHLLSFYVILIALFTALWFPNAIWVALVFYVVNQFEIVRGNQTLINHNIDTLNKNLRKVYDKLGK